MGKYFFYKNTHTHTHTRTRIKKTTTATKCVINANYATTITIIADNVKSITKGRRKHKKEIERE